MAEGGGSLARDVVRMLPGGGINLISWTPLLSIDFTGPEGWGLAPLPAYASDSFPSYTLNYSWAPLVNVWPLQLIQFKITIDPGFMQFEIFIFSFSDLFQKGGRGVSDRSMLDPWNKVIHVPTQDIEKELHNP